MAEDLQLLIERLQRDAVDEGQRRARGIVDEAEAKAVAIVRDAEAQAERLLERAAHDAEAFTERSTFALEQAGRDLLIAVSQAVERLLGGLVHESLMEELRPGLLAEMLAKMADAYAGRGGRERRMQVLLGEDDIEELVRLYAQRYRDRVREGVELKLDNSVVKGFRLRDGRRARRARLHDRRHRRRPHAPPAAAPGEDPAALHPAGAAERLGRGGGHAAADAPAPEAT
jgi:V/A-type H+/Na+-transporting ATPase subunit E